MVECAWENYFIAIFKSQKVEVVLKYWTDKVVWPRKNGFGIPIEEFGK